MDPDIIMLHRISEEQSYLFDSFSTIELIYNSNHHFVCVYIGKVGLDSIGVLSSYLRNYKVEIGTCL